MGYAFFQGLEEQSLGLSQSVSQSVSSVAQSCPTLCDPEDCSKSGFLVQHQLLELAETHVHQVGDAIQPSDPLSSPSPPPSILPRIRVFSNESIKKIWCTYTHNGTFSSVQFSRSIVSNSLQPHESQHARPSCPSPTPGVHSDSCPSSQ